MRETNGESNLAAPSATLEIAKEQNPATPFHASGNLFSSKQQAIAFWSILSIGLLIWCMILFNVTHLPPEPYFDEIYNAGAAQEYVEGRVVREQTHPPLYKLMEAISLWWYLPPGERAFSVDMETLAHAIRQPSVISSAGALLGMALLGLALYGPWVGLSVAFILACDPFFAIFGRTAMNYSYSLCFCLFAMACFVLALRFGQRRYLWATGLAFGLAFSTRWSAVFSYAAMLLLLSTVLFVPGIKPEGWKIFSINSWRNLSHAIISLFILPPFIYLLSYTAPIGNMVGWSWNLFSIDFIKIWTELQLNAYYIHSTHTIDNPSASKWFQWPFQAKSTTFSFRLNYAADSVSAIIGIGNPLIWASAPFILILAFARGISHRQYILLLSSIPALFLWLTWARYGDRLGFNHYFLEAIPYSILSIAGIAMSWWKGNSTKAHVKYVLTTSFLAINLAFTIYMWPLVTGQIITVDQYLNRMWRPGWESVSNITALKGRMKLSQHQQNELDQKHKLSLRSYLKGRKSIPQKARSHDDRGGRRVLPH